MAETGAFCQIYGDTLQNCVLEYMLENQELDFAVGDMAKELGISKPKAYEIVGYFERKDYVKKSRVVGKTQLYALNKENQRVKLFLRDFKECLKLIAEEYSEKPLGENTDTHEDEEYVLARVFLGNVEITREMIGGV